MERKTLFVINSLRIGGAEKVFVGLVNHCFAQRQSIEVLVLNLDDAELCKHLNPKVPIINLNIKHASLSFFKILSVLRKGRYKACVVFNFQIAVITILIRFIYGVDFRIITRGINTFSKKLKNETNWRHKYLNGLLIKKLYRYADAYIAQSQGMRRDMINSMGIKPEKITVIYNPAINLHLITEEQKNDGKENWEIKGKKKLLFVGSLKDQKNLPFMLESVLNLSKLRQDFHLMIVGGGSRLEALKNMVDSMKITDYVSFKGHCENPGKFYQDADLFLLTSLYEGFPNVLIEAMSFGVPVVSINCESGPADILEEGVNGYLVDHYDPEMFATMIGRALDREWNKKEISASISKFSADYIFKQYETLIFS